MAELRLIKNIKKPANIIQVLKSIISGGRDIDAYDTSKSYNPGDFAFIYDEPTNVLIVYKNNVSTTGPFDIADWSTYEVASEVTWANLEGKPTHTVTEIDDAVVVTGTKNQPGGLASLGGDGYVLSSQLPNNLKEIKVVNNIAARDALTKFEGLRAHVKDATGDASVVSGWAEYLSDGTTWTKTSEKDSIDVILEWTNIQNIPDATTLQKGIVRLNSAINSASETLAATSKAVKDAYDALNSVKAPLVSPALTGVPIAPTATLGTNTDQIATSSFVQSAVSVIDQKLVAQSIVSATLKHGWNYVLTAQASPLNMTIYGRTLVDIIGNVGNCESLTPFTAGGTGTASISTTQKKSGSSSLKLSTAAQWALPYRDYSYALDTAKQYVLAGWVFIESWTSGTIGIKICDFGANVSRYSANAVTSTIGSWQFVYVKIPTANTVVGSGFRLVAGTAGTDTWVAYFDEIRLYEVSTTDYAAIGTTYTAATTPSIDDFIPYVDGIQHLRNVGVTKIGKNMLPPFTEAIPVELTPSVLEAYSAQITATAIVKGTYFLVNVLPNTVYTASFGTMTGQWMITDGGGRQALPGVDWATITTPRSFNTGVNLQIRFYFGSPGAGTFTFTNPQLELGSVATTFEPRNDDFLILPVTLASNIDGSARDSVGYRDGAYRILHRWKKDLVPDGLLSWTFGGDHAGFKRLRLPNWSSLFPQFGFLTDTASVGKIVAIKYDGKILSNYGAINSWASGDIYSAGATANFVDLSVSDIDSGWTDTINPNVNAVKALMNGWKANGNNGSVYNSWVSVLDGSTPLTNTEAYVAANKASGWTGWITLSYQLADEQEEIIVGAEGAIALHPGGNMMELFEGVIIREKVTPKLGSNPFYHINLNNQEDTGHNLLKNRILKIIGIYRNGVLDKKWSIAADTAYGNERAFISVADYDSTADYHVTYVALDHYGMTPNAVDVKGEYLPNLGSVVNRNVQDISDLASRVSVNSLGINLVDDKVDTVALKLAAQAILTTALNHGWNYILTDQASPLNVTICGVSRVNIIGDEGNFEKDSNTDGIADGWSKVPIGSSVATLETTSVKYGTKAQRMTSLVSDPASSRRIERNDISVEAGKFYVFLVDVVTDGVASVTVGAADGSSTGAAILSPGSTINKTHFVKFSPTGSGTVFLRMYSNVAVGTVGWAQFDGAGLFEVDAALYSKIGNTITESNIRDFLPHVDGIQHLHNVGLTKIGKNMVGPFTEWTLHANAVVTEPYKLTLNAVGGTGFQQNTIKVPARPSTTYTISLASMTGTNVRMYVQEHKSDDTFIRFANNSNPSISNRTFTTDVDCSYLIVVLDNYNTTGTYTFDLPQLELGSIVTPFEPRNDDNMFLPVTLASNADGSVRDMVYYRDEAYRKLKRWQTDVALDGSLAWAFHSDQSGLKLVRLTLTMSITSYIAKWDGKIVRYRPTVDWTTGDLYVYEGGILYLAVADVDSGWTETLNPNNNASKALMNGWKANGNNGSVYNSWVSVLDGSAPSTNTEAYVATNKAPGWTGWATLSYQLADEQEEIIVGAEGAIALHPGGNRVELFEGVVLREKASPEFYALENRYYIANKIVGTNSYLENNPDKIIAIYKNGVKDTKWVIQVSVSSNAQNDRGKFNAFITGADYDPTADYHVTYITLDKYDMTTNAIDVKGEYLPNLGTVVTRNVQDISDLISKVSVNSLGINSVDDKVDIVALKLAAQAILTTTLKHGWNYILTDQASPLNVTIYGRTLVNLPGKDGNFEKDSNGDGVGDGWTLAYGAGAGVSTSLSTNARYGVKAQRIVANGTSTTENNARIERSFFAEAGKIYLLLCDFYTTVAGKNILSISSGATDKAGTIANGWETLYLKFTGDGATKTIRLFGAALNANLAVTTDIDGLRLYEISISDSAKVNVDAEWTGDKLIDKFPYVNGIQHLRNVRLTKSGKNMLDGIPEFSTKNANLVVNGPYLMTLNATGASQLSTVKVPVIPNTNYNLSMTHNGFVGVYSGTGAVPVVNYTTASSVTFNSGVNAEILVIFTNYTAGAGTYNFTNWQLELGSVATPLEPRNDDSLILPVTLASNNDGSVRDSVGYRDGAFRKLKRWQTDVALTGSLPVTFWKDVVGSKAITIPVNSIGPTPVNFSAIVSKHDGKILKDVGSSTNLTNGDEYSLDNVNFALYIPDTDSGWGEDYVPSADEIKAYFNGWTIYDSIDGSQWFASGNGGVKRWKSVVDGTNSPSQTIAYVSVNRAANYTPYSLTYQLLDGQEEIIVGVEGAFALHSGGNAAELFEGVILREKANPQLFNNSDYFINHTNPSLMLTPLKNRAEKILKVFKNGVEDKKWIIVTDAFGYGKQHARIPKADYDPTADYHVTYAALDKYGMTTNAIDAKGEYLPNLGTVVNRNVQDISDLTSRVSINSLGINLVDDKVDTAEQNAKNYADQFDERGTGLNSHAEGTGTAASGDYSHAEGIVTIASGPGSHAEGNVTEASGDYSHAEGNVTTASGHGSHAEGYTTTASGLYSHAEGQGAITQGNYSHAEGNSTTTSGEASHAEGSFTTASGEASHAEGTGTTASGLYSHAEGHYSIARGDRSHVEGTTTFTGYAKKIIAVSVSDHVITLEGSSSLFIIGDSVAWSYASGSARFIQLSTVAAISGATITVNNISNLSVGSYVMLVGRFESPYGHHSHAEGINTIASGFSAHAEGIDTIASGDYAHAEGNNTIASQIGSHVMGKYGDANESYSWFLANGTGSSTRGLAVKISGTGAVTADGAYSSAGADYAESFEWVDGNINNEERAGFFVTLDGDKIRKATPLDDYILGIISAVPSIIGDGAGLRWQGKYLTDEWGRTRYHFVTIPAEYSQVERFNEDGTSTIEQVEVIPSHLDWQPMINPDWDPNEPYVDRLTRPEWSAVGMMGKLLVRDDGTCQVNGFCRPNDDGIATISTTPRDGVSYRVMKRINSNIIQILVK